MTLSIYISITLVNLGNIIHVKTSNPVALNTHSSLHSAQQSLNVCRKKAMRRNMETIQERRKEKEIKRSKWNQRSKKRKMEMKKARKKEGRKENTSSQMKCYKLLVVS